MQNTTFERNIFATGIGNNIIYNPGKSAIHFYDKPEHGGAEATVVGNVVVAGPDTPSRMNQVFGTDALPPGTAIYLDQNAAFGTDVGRQ